MAILTVMTPAESALFGDGAADARMRALIPRFARLGALLIFVSALAVAPDLPRAAYIVAIVAIALGLTETVQRSGYLPAMPHRALAGLLVLYGALIAAVSALSGGWHSPYALIQVLPLAFGAMFFSSRDSYVCAVALWVTEQAVISPFDGWGAPVAATRLGVFLLIACFGIAISSVLREAVASSQALHSVLEKASGDPFGPDLASAGLDAALRVSSWDGGAVVIADGDLLPLAAIRGFGPDVDDHYAVHPMSRGDGSMTARVMETGTIEYVDDAPAFLGADHPVSRNGVLAMAGVPIAYHGEVIGVLILDTRQARRFDEIVAGQLLRIGEQLGLALGNAQAHRREAQVSERLRDLNTRKDEFLATISHELRTPVTSIYAAAQLLLERGEQLTPAERTEIWQRQVARARELTGLIDSLLAEATAESGGSRLTLYPVDLNTAVARWVRAVELQTSRAIELSVPLLAISAMVDATKIERIVTNLLSNAVKFSEPDSVVSCRLEADGDNIRIAVTDRGHGIADVDVDRIFDRFAQVDASATRAHGGFGIGLALARRYAEAHGGRLTVESEPHVGSTFTLHLSRRALGELQGFPAA